MPQARDEAGNIWETDAQGNPVRLLRVGGSAPSSVAPNPIKVREANAGYDSTVTGTQGKVLDNRITAATLPAQITKTNAEATQAQQGTRMNGLGDKQYSDALDQFNSAMQIQTLLGDLRGAYKEGPGATKGLAGFQDYVPDFLNGGNERFNTAANRMRAFAKAGTGATGGENNTATEMKINLGSYIPSSRNRDATIEDNFKAMNDLSVKGFRQAIQRLGGVPDGNGNIYPLGSPEAKRIMQGSGITPDVWAQVAPMQDQLSALPAGGDKAKVMVPPEMQGEFSAYYAQHAGNLDPVDYANFRRNLAAKYNFVVPESVDLQREAEMYNDYYRKGSRSIPNLNAPDQELSKVDQLRNSVANNPFGAGAINFADSVAMGGVSALQGDRMQALNEANPTSALIGQIGGAVAGSEGLGYLGRQTLGRALPQLMGGGAKAKVARQIAQDATYGAGYGQNVNGDAITGAAFGGIGSGVGQVGGKILGRGIGGVRQSQAVQDLLDARIPLTTGQRLGGIAQRIEDRAMSVPVVGDVIRNRRIDSMRAFDQAARNEAGAPIGAQFQPGGNWVDELPQEFGQAYDNATAGARVQLDPQFASDMAAARAAGAGLPPDLAGKFNLAINNRVSPIATAGEMTGDTYQQAMRGLKGYKSEMTKPGFEGNYRDALSGVQNALKGQMVRGGGGEVVSGLAKADEAYRLAKTLQKAQQGAVNGTGSGAPGVVTPAQLNRASIQSASRYPGARPFANLGDAGQEVLPATVPDSGTAGRLMLSLGALGGAGGYAADGQEGAAKGLALAALLAGGGTKAGQRVINAGLFNRPAAARTIGDAVSKQKGLLGSALIPLLLEAQK